MTSIDPTLPSWGVRLLSEIDTADRRAIAVAKTLTIEQLNWRVRPHEWSIGQCLDHLRLANEVYCRPMEEALLGRPVGVVQEITPGWFGRWFMRKYIEPSSKTTRGRAPRKITPSLRVGPSILDEFVETNSRVRALVLRAKHYDVNRIRFQNPFIPIIWFTVGTGLELLTKHEQRHLLQAERIRESLRRFGECE